MPGHGVPTWEQVRRRRYEPWPDTPDTAGTPGTAGAPLVIDNIGDPAGHVERIVAALSQVRQDKTGR